LLKAPPASDTTKISDSASAGDGLQVGQLQRRRRRELLVQPAGVALVEQAVDVGQCRAEGRLGEQARGVFRVRRAGIGGLEIATEAAIGQPAQGRLRQGDGGRQEHRGGKQGAYDAGGHDRLRKGGWYWSTQGRCGG
jgi:hypothetical protein